MTAALALLALGAFLAAAHLAVRLARARAEASRVRDARAELEERVRRLEAQLADASANHARFLGSVTHELRTPLTAIIGYQELLDDGVYGALEERCREPIRRIGSAAEHLLRLVDGVLDLARLDAGRATIRLAPADIAAACLEAAKNVRDAARVRDVSVQLQIAGDLPRVTSDPDRLSRTIELALTAAVHTVHGGTLTLIARPAAAGAAEIGIEASANGPDATAHRRSADGEGSAPAFPVSDDTDRSDEQTPQGTHLHQDEHLADSAGFRLGLVERLASALGIEFEVRTTAAGASIQLRVPAAVPTESTPAAPASSLTPPSLPPTLGL